MPIRFQYDAAAVVPPSSNELKKYGGQMLMQQRKYDLDQMRDQRNNQMRMQNIAAMQNYNAEPSIGEDDAMLEQEIRSGAYDPDTVRSLRDDQRAMRQIMRDRNIDGTQRAQALDNLRSRMRMMRSTGRVQPMMQTQPSTPRQPPTAAQAFAQNDKLEERFMGMIEPVNPDGTPMPYEERLKKAMEMYDTRQRMLFGQPAQQPALPAGQPQGQMPPQQSAGNPASMVRHVALGPGHPDYKPVPTPTNQRDEEGYVIMSDGSRVDPRDDFAMSTGGRGQQAVVRLTHPNGSPKERRPPESYLELAGGGAPAMMLNGGQRQPNAQEPRYIQYTGRLVGEPGIPNLIAGLGDQSDYQPQATQAAPVTPPQAAPTTTPAKKGARGYISVAPRGGSVTELGRNPVYSQDGKFLGDTGLYDQQGADYIRRQAAGVQPMAQPVSTGRAGFDAAMGSNLDTAYDLANMDRSPGTNFFNPENPAYAAMRAPAPQQSTGNVGQFKGRYGLGGVDYGINPATGNRVTASIRPGGGLEFDEPVGKPGTAMGGRKGSVTIMGGRKKPAAGAEVSPGVSTPEQQAAYNALPEAPVVPQTAPAVAGANYQYQSPIAQTVANVPQPATPARKYGGSSLISPAGMEVEAAMQAGEELAAREQAAEAARQQQAFQFATAPPPVSMSDEERKRLGLPTSKELMEMRKSIDQNKAMGGISLGGTGRAAGSYEPPTSPQKPKETPKAGKSASQQTVMSQAIKDFASKQKPDVQKAIMEAYDTKLSDRLRENAVRFLLSIGIDLDNMAPSS